MATLTAKEFPEIATLTVECEVCGETLPVPVKVTMETTEGWNVVVFTKVVSDTTDIQAHYLTHV